MLYIPETINEDFDEDADFIQQLMEAFSKPCAPEPFEAE